MIEDNPTNLQLVMYLLQAFGHDVSGAKEGADGIEMARQHRPDLILLDIHMPRMDGYEVARCLREDPDYRQIPIVAVTALAMVGDREKLLSAGFSGYISKPIDPETFVGKVQEFLGSPPAAQPSPAGRTVNGEPARNAEAASRVGKPAVVLFVDNCAVNLRLARSILVPHGFEVVSAASVREGLDLARSYRPDLIVSDIHMPVQDGYAFIDLVRADPMLREIPFIFLSSSLYSEHDADKARASGAIKLLNRPVEPKTLVSELKSCLLSRKLG